MKRYFNLFLLFTSFILANECTDIIALSKVSSSTIENKSSLEQHTKNFCKEYSSSNENSKSANYGLSYKFLSASMGTGRTSTESIASKYCSGSNSKESRKDSYKQYIETISPHAYSAYEQCITMLKQKLKFKLNLASILPSEFSIAVSFTSDVNGDKAELSFKGSTGVSCNWQNSKEAILRLKSGSSGSLHCTRTNKKKPAYVHIVRTNSIQSMTIPWGAYNDKDMPINTLKSLETKYNRLIEENTLLRNSLKNSVVAFARKSCPNGWDEYKLAYGRFIRGIDKRTHELDDPDGTRKIGDLQGDRFASHDHKQRYQNIKGNYNSNGKHMLTSVRDGSTTGQTTTSEGYKYETRPKNVALLYCIKSK